MIFLWWFFGLLLALVWLDRVRDARNMRRVVDITSPEWDQNWGGPPFSLPGLERKGGDFPRVSIIVPARNEAPHVEAALRSVLSLDYPNYEVFAIDDRSTDSTGEIIDRLAAESATPTLHVLHITDLPSGWLGKPHAMWLAAEQAIASAAPPEWILFTDADVSFRSDCLGRAIAYAERERADHLVLFPSHTLRSAGEKIMLGGFQMLFVFGHRPWKVHDPDSDDFIGLGPFNLIRRSAYERIGTFRALRLEVIEDMKLGKLVKQHRLAQRNVLGPGLLPWSWGSGAFGLVRNLTKNLFALMQFRPAKALGASVLWLFLNLMPLAGAVCAPGWARLPYLAALAAIALIYIGMGRRTPVPAWSFLLYPIGTLLIVYTMLRSMAHAVRHRGVVWRGTLYDLEELRKGMV